MNDFYKNTLVRINELKKEKRELGEIVDFYEVILTVQKNTYSSYSPDSGSYNPDKGIKRNLKGLSFLEKEDIKVKEDLFKKIIKKVSVLIHKKKKEAIPEKVDFSAIIPDHHNLLEGLLENGLILEDIAKKMNMEYSLFYFLVNSSFSPFISRYAHMVLEKINRENWLKGYCPVCGARPFIGKLEEETGRKWLLCSLCYSEWPFKRLACPYCENEDQESLRFFFDEKSDSQGAHRIDVCDKCKGYIKTIDIRKLGNKVNLFVENLATLELDIVAGKEGFKGGMNIVL